MAIFNQYPFATAPIDDGYTAPQDVRDTIQMLASNYRYGSAEYTRRVDPIIGQYFYGPVDSVVQTIVLHRSQNPGLLPSGTL